MPADFPSKVVAVMLSSWRLIGQLWYYLAAGILLAAWLDQVFPPLVRWWSSRTARLSASTEPGQVSKSCSAPAEGETSPALSVVEGFATPKGNLLDVKLQKLAGVKRIEIVLAALVGATSPLCTYGTVPVLVQLLQHGISPAPLLTFLVASSLMNPQLFVLMLGGLGLEVALAQLVSVLILSLTIGILAGHCSPPTLLNQRTLAADLVSDEGELTARASPFSWSRWLSRVVSLTESVGLYFVIGIIIAAASEVFVPPAWVVKLLGREHWYSVLVAGSLGVPFYACGGGAIPWIKVLLDEGMSRGAALAFFLAGPATRVTALAALATILSRRALFLYVVFVFAGAAGLGYLFNLLG